MMIIRYKVERGGTEARKWVQNEESRTEVSSWPQSRHVVWRWQDEQKDVVRMGCSEERPGCWRSHPRNICGPNQVIHGEGECGIYQVSHGGRVLDLVNCGSQVGME